MLSEIISDIVCEHAQETHFFVQNEIRSLIEAYRLQIVFQPMKLSETLLYCKYHECTTGYFTFCVAKKGILTLNRCNWLRYVVIHLYITRYCKAEGIVWRRETITICCIM